MAIIPPNWTAILNKKGPFTSADIGCAGQWPTCAIGEAAHRFPSSVHLSGEDWDAPTDDTLYTLGMRFARAVEYNDRPLAQSLYRQIQARVAVLKTP
jgi:hypothetical protein